jgi:DNA polymerase III subunit delta'
MSSLFEDEFEELEDEFSSFDEGSVSSAPAQGPSPPRESDLFLSHTEIEKRFLQLMKAGKMPHGMIFRGAKGIGKATFAYRLARFLFKYGGQVSADAGLFGEATPPVWPDNMDVPRDDPVFRRVASGGHPDFIALEPAEDKKGLDVDQVRALIPLLRRTASDGGWRVVIIDDADTMNRNAQNALLKILEEPPANTALILIANNTSAFLPTVRSRCRMFDFKPLDQDAFTRLLQRHNPAMMTEEINQLYDMCAGSVGAAIHFHDTDGLSLFMEWETFVSTYPSFNYEVIHSFCNKFTSGGQDQSWQIFQRNVIWAVETLALIKARGQSIPTILQPLVGFMEQCPLDRLMKICDDLKAHFAQAEYGNLDKRQVVLESFMLMEP